MNKFIFKSYEFEKSCRAVFNYAFGDGRSFQETIQFNSAENYDVKLLDKAMFMAFIIIGVSYYKTFPSAEVELNFDIDKWQADFLNNVYQEGLGQFAYENGLNRDDLAHFKASKDSNLGSIDFNGTGILALQSGGKDSLLTAALLRKNNNNFTSFYVSSSNFCPDVIKNISPDILISRRVIDYSGLNDAKNSGGLNGHVPVTYVVQSLALIQAILSGKNIILTSIAHEGEESHAMIGDLSVNHQWSKTWQAEKFFSEYVHRYVSKDISIGSPLRGYSELMVAKKFVDYVWQEFGDKFSSCNIANYKQGSDNTLLGWCGNCPKCANSYLLFAPFLDKLRLVKIFNNQDLFEKESLHDDFKGLLGIDSVIKPFECVGEVDELRLAYKMAHENNNNYGNLPFSVPESIFDYAAVYESQSWARELVKE